MTEHIQINDVSPRISYIASGAQSAFSFPFAIFLPADLEIWLDDVQQVGGYAVSGAGISTGGTVLFAVPPAAAIRVMLRRRLTLARTSDFQADGLIRAKTLNDEFDYQVAALQQVAEDVGRAVRRSPLSPSLADLTLPEPAPDRGVKWNAAGTALVNTRHDPDAVGNAAQAAEDAVAAAAAAIGARDAALAAVGSVRVSPADPIAGPLADKLQAGGGIALSEAGGALVIASTISVPASLAQRLAFLESNLAINTLRDQIDTGWSQLKMVNGIADEFEDETGIDLAASLNQTYDGTGDYYTNLGGLQDRLVPGLTIAQTAGAAIVGGALVNLLDGDTASYAMLGNSATQRIEVTLAATAAIESLRFYLSNNDANRHAGTRVFTHDGTAWTQRGSEGANNGLGWHGFSFAPAAGTTKVAFEWDQGGGGSISIGEVEALAIGAAPSLTLVSKAAAAATPPAEARLLLLHQAVDAATPDTDCTIEASRDNGATWSIGALVDEGAFDAATRVLTALVDLTGQPAGTSLRWRFKTVTGKEQRLHGVWMQWR